MEDTLKATKKFLEEYPDLNKSATLFLPTLPLAQSFSTPVQIVQPYFEQANALNSAGLNSSPELFEKATDVYVVFIQRCREENFGYIGNIANHMPIGSHLVLVCSNDLGPKSYEKRLNNIFGNIEIFSKYKHRISFACKDQNNFNAELSAELAALAAPIQVKDSPLYSLAGCFSWKHLDEGSKLLTKYLPQQLTGHGADLGAGYGYLSHFILSENSQIAIDLFEHDHRALEMARSNCYNFLDRCKFNWCDLKRINPEPSYDWVVTNPPFHIGNKTSPELGKIFLNKAIEFLKPGGTIYAVANKSLPYEQVMSKLKIDVHEEKSFKILIAKR